MLVPQVVVHNWSVLPWVTTLLLHKQTHSRKVATLGQEVAGEYLTLLVLADPTSKSKPVLIKKQYTEHR